MSKYYIARDKDGCLRMFRNKPAKRGWNFWEAINDYSVKLRDNWFPEVKWEDKEPKVLTIEESPWISVEERYPPFDEKNPKQYLVRVCAGSIIPSIYYAVTPLTSRNHFGLEIDWTRVTHWMPIPEFKE